MFFKQFPKTQYSIENDAILTNVTDYFRYVDIVERLANNLYAYKKVQIGHGERPDVLSQRLYGTPNYYWTFFICNDSLKEGLSAWPKSDPELKNHISNQFENISAFRFPLSEPDTNDTRYTPLGIPILNSDYLPHLKLCRLLGAGVGNRLYAEAKIVDYDPNKSLIWIDNSTINWFSEVDVIQATNGDGGARDTSFLNIAKSRFFYTSASANDFTVQFRENGNPSDKIAFQNDVRATAQRFKPNLGFDTSPLNTIDRDYTIRSTQYWKDGSLAPAYYYDPVDTDEEIPEYEAGEEASNYKSIYDDMLEDNEALKEIKVVAPQYIESFVREYKKLLNE